MAELGIIASVVQIADTGLRLSIKLYTFGEIVATADKSVISISKDVSLTSSVLKELGSLLENDAESRIFSKNAVQTADAVVKECLEVFQEMESILVKKLPSLSGQEGIRGVGGKKSKATALLERMKWGYLQPKLQLLRSNLDRLKSTLLLMLNVITYARQVAGKSEPPSVIEDQRSLIEDLARSNQDYIRQFEQLKLGIQNTPRTQENIQSDSTGCGIKLQQEQDTQNHSHSKRKSMTSKRTATANVNINNMYINANVQSRSIPRGFEKTEQSPKTQEPGSEEDTLFSHLKHYLSLVNNLLDEVDEIKYEIRIDSRNRVRTDICQAYQREMKQLDTSHTDTKFVLADQHLAPLVAGVKRRLEQIDSPETGGQGTKRMSLGVVNGGPQQISQPQPDPAAMQFVPEGADDSYSMPFNDEVSDPDLLENFDFEQFLQSRDPGDVILVDPLSRRSCKTPENVAHATDVINNVEQYDEKMEEPIAGGDEDTGAGPADGHILMPRLQHGNLGASQQRLNPDQQFQRNHPLPNDHQQSHSHLNMATPNATATAGSKPPAYQGPNDLSPASAHYRSQCGGDIVIPRKSTLHSMFPSVQQPTQEHSTYFPLPRYGSMEQMARPNTQQQQAQQHHAARQMASLHSQRQQVQQPRAAQKMARPHPQQQPAQQPPATEPYVAAQQQLWLQQKQQAQRQQQQAQQHHHAAQQMARPHTQQQPAQQSCATDPYVAARQQLWLQQTQQAQRQQQQAQQHHAAQQHAAAQQQLQGLQHNQSAQRQQQHANFGSDDQTYQARGNGKAEKSLSQAQPIQGEPRSSLSRSQSAAPRSPTTEESPQNKRRRPSEEVDERRFHGASAPFTTSGSHSHERPLLELLRNPADEPGNLTGSEVQSNEEGTFPTYDDLMQEVEAAIVATLSWDEVDQVWRPSPPTASFRRSRSGDSHGSLWDYPIPGQDNVIPFAPARLDKLDHANEATSTQTPPIASNTPRKLFGLPSARVDMTDTGGFVEADAQSQRLCFSEPRCFQGNEATSIPPPLIASNTPRKPLEDKERNINPMSGHKINEDGEVRHENGKLIGMVTDGHLPILAGLEVDDNGCIVDCEGNKVGECALMQSLKGERSEAQLPQSVADSRPQMSSITQISHYDTTLPEAPLQQLQHVAPVGSFSTSNQVFPPDNAMIQYNNATNDSWEATNLTKFDHLAANMEGSPKSTSEISSKASLKRDLLALNDKTVVRRARNRLAAHNSRSKASEKGRDGESEKPEANEKAVPEASQPRIVLEAITHQCNPNPGSEQALKRPWQAQTPPPSSTLGVNEIGMEGEIPKDKRSKFAMDELDTILDLDLGLDLGLNYSPTTPNPSKQREEEEGFYMFRCSVPVAGKAGKAGNVVDELVTLWTLLPVG